MAKKTKSVQAAETAPVVAVTTDTGTAEVAPTVLVTTEAAPAVEVAATAPESLEEASKSTETAEATPAKKGRGKRTPERPPIRQLPKKGTPAPEAAPAPTPTTEATDAPKKPRGRPRKDGLPPGTVTVLEPAPLSPDEKTRLEEIERAVDTDMATATDAFSRVSKLLHEVHEKRLYRDTAKSFPEYVEKRFHIGGRAGWYQVAAAGVVKALESQGVTNLPRSEAQARPLAALASEPEKQVQAWEESHKIAMEDGGKQEPERKHVEQAVARVTGKEAPSSPAPASSSPPATTQEKAVQAAQANGVVPSGTVIDVTPAEDEEPGEPPVDIEMRDDKWLAQYPLDSILKGLPLKIFRAEALAYRWLASARQSFVRTVFRPIVKEAVRDSGRSKLGPYLHRVRWGVSGPAPDKWVLCESCQGSGQVPTIGECKDCNGSGYRVPSKG